MKTKKGKKPKSINDYLGVKPFNDMIKFLVGKYYKSLVSSYDRALKDYKKTYGN